MRCNSGVMRRLQSPHEVRQLGRAAVALTFIVSFLLRYVQYILCIGGIVGGYRCSALSGRCTDNRRKS